MDNSNSYGVQDLADRYRGIKTLEYMVRDKIKHELPDELTPEKLEVASKIGETETNACADGYDEWTIRLPVGNEDEVSASMPAVVAEEIGHNTEDGVTDHSIDSEGRDWEYINLRKTYAEAVGSYMRELVFEDNIEEEVEVKRSQLQAIDDYYGDQAIEEIQESIPKIKNALARAWDGAQQTEGFNEKVKKDFDKNIDEAMDVAEIPDIPNSDGHMWNPVDQYIRHATGPPDWSVGHPPTKWDPTMDRLTKRLETDRDLNKEEFRDNNTEFIEQLKSTVKKRELNLDQPHLVGREFYLHVKNSDDKKPEDLLRKPKEDVIELKEEFENIAAEHGINGDEFTPRDKLGV